MTVSDLIRELREWVLIYPELAEEPLTIDTPLLGCMDIEKIVRANTLDEPDARGLVLVCD